MNRAAFIAVLGLFLVVSTAQAGETLPSPPSTHNEYNNSTIYYGTQGAQPQYNDDDYGIRTYRDPETGDRITSVRSRPNQNQQQQAPIYVEPRIRP